VTHTLLIAAGGDLKHPLGWDARLVYLGALPLKTDAKPRLQTHLIGTRYGSGPMMRAEVLLEQRGHRQRWCPGKPPASHSVSKQPPKDLLDSPITAA